MAILQEKLGLSREDLRKLRGMRPGLSVDLQVMSPNGIKRVRTEFIGMDGRRSLIFKFPDEARWGNLRDAIYADSAFVVRYIHEEESGEVVAFKVKTIVVLSKPGNYIFTTFPLSIQCHALRAEQRAKAQIGAQIIQAGDSAQNTDVVIVDLSLSGCRVSIDRLKLTQKFDAKETIRLQVNSPSGGLTELIGVIMNQRSDETHLYVGIKFESDESLIAHLLQQLMVA